MVLKLVIPDDIWYDGLIWFVCVGAFCWKTGNLVHSFGLMHVASCGLCSQMFTKTPSVDQGMSYHGWNWQAKPPSKGKGSGKGKGKGKRKDGGKENSKDGKDGSAKDAKDGKDGKGGKGGTSEWSENLVCIRW